MLPLGNTWSFTTTLCRPVGEAYPDIVALDESGHKAGIEVEFESANSEREHKDETDKCDIVACWKNTWGRAAIKPVIELAGLLYWKTEIQVTLTDHLQISFPRKSNGADRIRNH